MLSIYQGSHHLKNESPYASNYEMPIAPLLSVGGFMTTSPFHAEILSGLSLHRCCACCHNYSKFIYTVALLCPENTRSLKFSSTSPSYHILTPHSSKISGPMWCKCIIRMPFCYQPLVYNTETCLRRSIECKQNIKGWENNLDFK